MWPFRRHLGIRALQANALFASGLQRSDEPSAGQVRQAIATAIQAFGGSGCAGRVAQEFGDHPDTAVIRMRWACAMAGAAFAEPALQRAVKRAPAFGLLAPSLTRLTADTTEAGRSI